jgi:hypothetical protein
VAGESAHNPEAVPAHLMINRAADFVHQDTGAGNGGACGSSRATAHIARDT